MKNSKRSFRKCFFEKLFLKLGGKRNKISKDPADQCGICQHGAATRCPKISSQYGTKI